jgi:hypothetical protein
VGQVVDAIRLGLDSEQRANALVVEEEFGRAGFAPEIAAAAIANAWAESRLRTFARSRSPEDSAGIFQLNARGAGADMPKGAQYPGGDSRFDPVLNTRRIIREIRETSFGRRFLAQVPHAQGDVGSLAALFCQYIERPKDDLGEKALSRGELARTMFPQGVGRPLPSSTLVARVPASGANVAYALLFLTVATTVASVAARDRQIRLAAT